MPTQFDASLGGDHLKWWEPLVRITIATGVGALIGGEREWIKLVRHRSGMAGLRTHILVCSGSCLLQMVSAYGYRDMPDQNRDPSRLAAQVVTGIGFLGAGAIMNDRFTGEVTGLTTAASLWICMALGLAIGVGYWYPLVVTTVLVLMVLTFFKKVRDIIGQTAKQRGKRRIRIYYLRCQLEDQKGVVTNLMTHVKRCSLTAQLLHVDRVIEESKADESPLMGATLVAYVKAEADLADERLLSLVDEMRTILSISFLRQLPPHVHSMDTKDKGAFDGHDHEPPNNNSNKDQPQDNMKAKPVPSQAQNDCDSGKGISERPRTQENGYGQEQQQQFAGFGHGGVLFEEHSYPVMVSMDGQSRARVRISPRHHDMPEESLTYRPGQTYPVIPHDPTPATHDSSDPHPFRDVKRKPAMMEADDNEENSPLADYDSDMDV